MPLGIVLNDLFSNPTVLIEFVCEIFIFFSLRNALFCDILYYLLQFYTIFIFTFKDN